MSFVVPHRPPDRRLAVRLTPDGLRQVRGGHPWVFEGSVRSVGGSLGGGGSGGGGGDLAAAGVAGQLAVIFDERRRFVAVGLWDPVGPIRVRILHRGAPRTVDDAFWRQRVADALAVRRELLDDPSTTGFRLVHGENDRLPGLVADRYGTTVVLKVYSSAWFPHLDAVVEALLGELELAGVTVDRVVRRVSRGVRRTLGLPSDTSDAVVLLGSPVHGPVPFLERGLRFEADVLAGQKTGHFLDQRDNRVRVGERSAGARVLDVFACTGGFSVHAAAGGAVDVTSVDLSRRSLDTAARNWELNLDRPAVAAARHHLVVSDAFDALEDLGRRGRRFDLVIVDPPSFAHRARDRSAALHAYRRLAELGSSLVEPGGRYVQSSCSSRVDAGELYDAVRDGVAAAGRHLHLEEETGHPVDHPVGFVHGAYLSTVFGRVES